MTPKKRNVNRSASDRLRQTIEAELRRQKLTEEEAAREARLPANAFRGVRKGQRPSIDRADELCRALGITMTIGNTPTADDGGKATAANEGQRVTDQ